MHRNSCSAWGSQPRLHRGCAADRPPEETTPDGLVRVPARSVGGVYRAPDATFTQYQRLILEPPSISFIKDWAENHPEVSPTELARIRAESVELFRDEFTRELVKRGPYKFADEPAPDVLLVVPAIEELDIKAPEAAVSSPATRTYLTGRPVTMKVTGELRDALTGKLVGRVIIYRLPEQNPNNELRIANRATQCARAAPGVRGVVGSRARGTQCGEGSEAPDAATFRARAAVTRRNQGGASMR